MGSLRGPWFGVNPLWIALPVAIYLAALSVLVLSGAAELAEPLFVLVVMGVALPLLARALTRSAARSKPPAAPLARGELGSVLAYVAAFAVLVLGFGFSALHAALPQQPVQDLAKTALKLLTMVALPVLLLRRYGRDRSAWLRPWLSWRTHGVALLGIGIALNLVQAVFGRGLKTISELDPSA